MSGSTNGNVQGIKILQRIIHGDPEIGGSPSGSVYGSTTGSHDASYNGSGCPTDDEEDYDDDGGDAFEEMIDALSEIETKTMTSSKPPPASAATSKTTKQEDAR